MRALAARRAGDIAAEQRDRAAVGRDLAGDQIEQRGLTGAIGTDDQPPLARRDIEIDVRGHAQTAERLVQTIDAERGHGGGAPTLPRTGELLRSRNARQPIFQMRTDPGTKPSGMKVMMATKITPSTRFTRCT